MIYIQHILNFVLLFKFCYTFDFIFPLNLIAYHWQVNSFPSEPSRAPIRTYPHRCPSELTSESIIPILLSLKSLWPDNKCSVTYAQTVSDCCYTTHFSAWKLKISFGIDWCILFGETWCEKSQWIKALWNTSGRSPHLTRSNFMFKFK